MHSLFISCGKGLEDLLANEVRELGFHVRSIHPQGIYGDADLAMIYHLCLWSRIAQRIQLMLFTAPVTDQETLYTHTHAFPWHEVFSVESSFAIAFHGTSPNLRNSMFGAQVMKDAIVDYFRHHEQRRPMVDRENPDLYLHAHLKNDVLSVSLDLTGFGLHQRGYRLDAGRAPIKENSAAALLVRAQWPLLMLQNAELHDPFCGSGTLVIEAAMMAAHAAPGLLRTDQSFQHWRLHDEALWQNARKEAEAAIRPLAYRLRGTDQDPRAITQAQANAQRAGVSDWVTFECIALKNIQRSSIDSSRPGLVISNPPYGERLMGDDSARLNHQDPLTPNPALISLYQTLGQILHTQYQGWDAAIFTAEPSLAKAIGLRAQKRYAMFNGAIRCQLYCIHLDAQNRLKDPNHQTLSESAHMFANRLRKNHQHFKKWAKRQGITCYRVYDADCPEYAFAIDLYNDYAVLQEYAAPASIPIEQAEKHAKEVLHLTPQILEIAPEKIIKKERKPQKGLNQYEKLDVTHRFLTVREGLATLQVNLYDYLDTGLFLDHRKLRLQFAQLPAGTRFLNCFCYTASASVHAALAGALTTNVDLSNTYLHWAKENYRLNHIDLSLHQFVSYDCLEWLKIASDQFDVIFLDPPSFSNSKRMQGTLDIQRDHEALLQATMKRLLPQGALYFSTNCKTFKLSPSLMEMYQIKDITPQTIDLDFKRHARIHRCFILRHL